MAVGCVTHVTHWGGCSGIAHVTVACATVIAQMCDTCHTFESCGGSTHATVKCGTRVTHWDSHDGITHATIACVTRVTHVVGLW